MKQNTPNYLVLSDYPIKMMSYRRFLASLGIRELAVFDALPPPNTEFDHNTTLLVFDMNVMRPEEPAYLQRLLGRFPRANILFLEEDHAQCEITDENGRCLCILGKLAPVDELFYWLRALSLKNRDELSCLAERRALKTA